MPRNGLSGGRESSNSGEFVECPHLVTDSFTGYKDFHSSNQKKRCNQCDFPGSNKWLCLKKNCSFVGCGKKGKNHAAQHARMTKHELQINMKSARIWCHECDREIKQVQNGIPTQISDRVAAEEAYNNEAKSGCRTIVQVAKPELITVADDSVNGSNSEQLTSTGSSEVAGCSNNTQVRQFFITGRPYKERERPTAVVNSIETMNFARDEEPYGLTGLRNLGNTCYMNAALQTLSNTVALTEYLLNCRGPALGEKSRCLASEYGSLVDEIWSDRRPSYLVPYNILSWIRLAHPAFRGFQQQQDAQEFLRCFLDQLHEDLKQPVYEWECQGEQRGDASIRGRESTESAEEPATTSTSRSTSGRSSSGVGELHSDDGSYLTCDSGWSSDKETKRTRTLSTPAGSPAKRRRAALSESDSSEFSDALQEWSPSSLRRISATTATKRKTLRCISGMPRRKPIRFRSIVSDVFDGKLLSSVQCLTCNTVSETRETFQDLSLPIPGREQIEMLRSMAGSAEQQQNEMQNRQSWWNYLLSWINWMSGLMSTTSVSLEDCLAAFFSADDLKGDDMYSCDRCKKLRNGVKCCYLLHLPEVLCIHLKRFRHELMYSTKISTRITFPLDGLDMRPFTHSRGYHAGECVYDLYAVICHHGSADGGHYTSYCLNASNGRWYEFDDHCVTEVDPYVVQNAEAYVLFYKKRSIAAQLVRDEVFALLRCPEKHLMRFYISQEWINRFNTMSDPGPITNFDFLCPHGCIHSKKLSHLTDLYAEVPYTVWHYLYKRFGGGPVCSQLLHCVDCQQYHRQLKLRRDKEIETFYRLQREYKQMHRADLIYALSMRWFQRWEAFVLNHEDEPPGPVDNGDIVTKKTEKNEYPRPRTGANYATIHRDLWEFYYSTYGGGPEVLLTSTVPSISSRTRVCEPLVAETAALQSVADAAGSARSRRLRETQTDATDESSKVCEKSTEEDDQECSSKNMTDDAQDQTSNKTDIDLQNCTDDVPLTSSADLVW